MALCRRDGRGSNAPPRPPNGSNDKQGSTVSPAVPAVVVICCLVGVVLFTWWFLKRARRHRRRFALLGPLGLVPKPKLVEVRMQRPRSLRVEDGWATLSPLAATKLPAMDICNRKSARASPPSPSAPSLGRNRYTDLHESSGHDIELTVLRHRWKARRSPERAADTLQVSFLVAMPSSRADRKTNGYDGRSGRGAAGLPDLCIGVADVRYG
ncbi:hypothetical protein OH77DRAFT_1417378 [Trametes cingulata]|nr:hypothetical protein OH77DRAFT_1417378 [Trametes cingulata]